MDIDTLWLDEKENCIVAIDQTKLPGTLELIELRTAEEIWNAIYLLQVRGAPAIGVCAGFGIYLLAKEIYDNSKDITYADFYQEFLKQKDYLNSSRPTAVNLSWALNRMDIACQEEARKGTSVKDIIERLHTEAVAIRDEDIAVCKAIGENGLKLVKKDDGILTHCNAGKLCAVNYGTATAPIYLGQERGYNFKVYADETRPLLQGARLTATELKLAGVDVTLICDNMSATVFCKGLVNAVFVGCDRVAANGDVANKIGTSMVALAAKRYGVPFYVCAPFSTIDTNTKEGKDIVIEERPGAEITDMWYEKPMAMEGVKTFNPAFDVTDHDLVTAIVTEKGVFYPPYSF